MTKLEEILDQYLILESNRDEVIAAMKEYSQFACEQQKKICAENVKLRSQYGGYEDLSEHKFNNKCDIWIDEKSILNSPTFKEDDTRII